MSINILTDKKLGALAHNQAITPTLFIGIGGSGKKVLYQLRRLYYEKYAIPALPIMKFIYFDTDVNDLTTTDPDTIDTAIELDNSDIIDASIRQDQFENLMVNLSGLYPHIANWFEKDHLEQAATIGIVHGAKQIRALGRLSFFLKYDDLLKQIRNKVNFSNAEIQESIDFMNNRGIISPLINNTGIEIVVVGSLAGGTCSGTLVDIGFLCRSIGLANASVTGIFFLPSAFSTLDEKKGGFSYKRAKANGYAALMELNYYMSPYLDDGNTASLIFEWKRDEKIKVAAPAYHIAYLLDNKNLKNRFDEDYKDVFNMAAEFLFLDYNESTFSTTKRSLHSNTNVVLGSNTYVQYDDSNYVQRFPNRFSSFGLSQIRMNIDKIKNASQNLITSKLFQKLLAHNDVRSGWHTEDNWTKFDFTEDIIIEKLSQYNAVNNFFKDEKNLINEGTDDVQGFDSINASVIGSRTTLQIVEMDAYIHNTILNCNKLIKLCENSVLNRLAEGDITGEAVQSIKQNRDIYKRDIKARLQEEIIGRFLFNYNTYGINYANEFIDIVLNQIEKLIKNFNAYKSKKITIAEELNFNNLPEVDLSELSREVLQYEALMKESQMLLPIPPKFKTTAQHHFTNLYETKKRQYEKEYINLSLQVLTEVIQAKKNELLDYIEISYKKKIAILFLPILDNIKTFISELKTKVGNYVKSVKASKELFYKHYISYKKSDENSRNNDLDLGWDDHTYIQNILENVYVSEIDSLIDTTWNNIFNELKTENDGNVYIKMLEDAHLNILHSKQNWNHLEGIILRHTLNSITPFKINGTINTAVQLFNQSFPDTSKKRLELENRIDFSAPRIQFSAHRALLSQLSTIALLGVDTRETQFIQQVNGIAGAGIGFQAQQFSDDSIIFFQELIGLPVFAIGETDEFARCYASLIREDPSNLYKCHMEKSIDKYFELLLPKTNEALARTLKYDPFLLGLILGDIIFDENSNRFILLRQDNMGVKRKEPLSSSLVKSIHLLNDIQLNHLEREAGINGRKIRKMRENDIEDLFRLESTLFYSIDIANNVLRSINFGGFKLNVLEKHLEDLYKKIRLKLYQSLQIPEAETLNSSVESLDVLAERDPHIKVYKTKKERYSKSIDSFSKIINYSDSRIKGNFRVLKS